MCFGLSMGPGTWRDSSSRGQVGRYNSVVTLSLWLVIALLVPQQRPAPPPDPDLEEETVEPEYTFNPFQAAKEVEVGNFYFKKGSYKAAAGRYERATKWQPDLVEAYYKLGVAREKAQQWEPAVAAYRKYLEVAGSSRRAGEVKKKIARLEAKIAKPDVPSSRPPAPRP